MRRDVVIGKIQPSERCYGLAFVFSWIEFAFGRLSVMTIQASWLEQEGRRVLIGQRACWLITQARESIDRPRAKNDRLHAYRDKWQLAATVFSREKGNVENQILSKKIVWTHWFYFRLSKSHYWMMHHSPVFWTKFPGISKQVAALQSQSGLKNRGRFSQHNDNPHHFVWS